MGKRGPEGWKPTREQRSDVRLWAACGISEPVISSRLGISHMTLRKHCADELKTGNEEELAVNLKRLKKAADAGNVTAMKYLQETLRRHASQREFTVGDNTTIVRSTDKRVGKKEEQRDAAIRAMEGGDDSWGADLSPELPN